MKAWSISPETVDRMEAMRRDGMSMGAIARAIGCSRPTVQAWLRRRDAGLRGDDGRAADASSLATGVSWLLLPPARIRVQLAAEGR